MHPILRPGLKPSEIKIALSTPVTGYVPAAAVPEPDSTARKINSSSATCFK